jgi:hypothetical protein
MITKSISQKIYLIVICIVVALLLAPYLGVQVWDGTKNYEDDPSSAPEQQNEIYSSRNAQRDPVEDPGSLDQIEELLTD